MVLFISMWRQTQKETIADINAVNGTSDHLLLEFYCQVTLLQELMITLLFLPNNFETHLRVVTLRAIVKITSPTQWNNT